MFRVRGPAQCAAASGQSFLRDEHFSARFYFSLRVRPGSEGSSCAGEQATSFTWTVTGRRLAQQAWDYFCNVDCNRLAGKHRSAAEQCETLCVLDFRVSGYLEKHWQQLRRKKLCAKDFTLQPLDQHGFAITTPFPLFREVVAGPLVSLYLL